MHVVKVPLQITTSREAKIKVIELLWPTIEERIGQLETLQNLLPVLDSEHIKNTPSLSASLAPIGSKQMDQIENIRGFVLFIYLTFICI